MFKFSFTLNDDDYFEANKYHFLNSSAGKKAIWLLRLLMPIAFALGILISCREISSFGRIITTIAWIIASVLWVIFAKSIVLKNLRKNIGKLKKDGKLPYNKETSILFDNESIIANTSESETKSNYQVIERVVENEKAVYIYVNSMQVYMIPLSAFADDEERKCFIAFIKNKIAEARKVL